MSSDQPLRPTPSLRRRPPFHLEHLRTTDARSDETGIEPPSDGLTPLTSVSPRQDSTPQTTLTHTEPDASAILADSEHAHTKQKQNRTENDASSEPSNPADVRKALEKAMLRCLPETSKRRYPPLSHLKPMIERKRFNPSTPPASAENSRSPSPSALLVPSPELSDEPGYACETSRSHPSSEGSSSSAEMPAMPDVQDMAKMPESSDPRSKSHKQRKRVPAWNDSETLGRVPWSGTTASDQHRDLADADRRSPTHVWPYILDPRTSYQELFTFVKFLAGNPGPRGAQAMDRDVTELVEVLFDVETWVATVEPDHEMRPQREFEATWALLRAFVDYEIVCQDESLLYRNVYHAHSRLRCAQLPTLGAMHNGWRYATDEEYADRRYFSHVEFSTEEDSLRHNKQRTRDICTQLSRLLLTYQPDRPERPIVRNLLAANEQLTEMLASTDCDDKQLNAMGMYVVKTAYELMRVLRPDSKTSAAQSCLDLRSATEMRETWLQTDDNSTLKIMVRKPTD